MRTSIRFVVAALFGLAAATSFFFCYTSCGATQEKEAQPSASTQTGEKKEEPKAKGKDDKEKSKEEKAKDLATAITKLEVGATFVSVETATWVYTLPSPTAGYVAFKVKTRNATDKAGNKYLVPDHTQWRIVGKGKATSIANSDGKCASLGVKDGTTIVLVPTGASGIGGKIGELRVVFLPYRGNSYTPPVLVEPVASEAYPGFEEFRFDSPGIAFVRFRK